MDNLPQDCQSLSTEQTLSLNRTCQCVSLTSIDTGNLTAPTNTGTDFFEPVDHTQTTPGTNRAASDHTSLFASTAVFVTETDIAEMQQQIDAIESIASLPRYREQISQRSTLDLDNPQIHTRGLLMGYDFHLTAHGPQLIEVNTNAGGAFIMHALLSRVRQSVSLCDNNTLDNPADIEAGIIDMFVREWQLAGRSGRPRTVAIVDSDPQTQFLYPDMQLAKSMLARNNIDAVICAPESLSICNGDLYQGSVKIDLVYNRSTDFTLAEHAQKTLRNALEQDSAVISPAPSHHALLADKRNPAIWQNTKFDLGANQQICDTLSRLPTTESVTTDSAARFWNCRRKLFFKPDAGYGSKATYRGDKVTKKVWEHITSGGYIAQTLKPPALRIVGEGNQSQLMKFDLRVYTYNGQRLLSAARVYQGQTTNFRTPGGGFAPVIYLD